MNRTTRLSLILFLVFPVSQAIAETGYKGERNQFNRFHGQGTYVNSRGSYVGSWVDGAKSGKGAFTAKNGEVYTGQWSDNKRHGSGKQVYLDGSVYQGAWQANQRDGKGTLTYKNGDKLTADWTFGEVSGSGVYAFKKGIEYKGSIVNNKPEGKGQCKEKGVAKPCEFKNGVMVAAPVVVAKVVKKPKPKPKVKPKVKPKPKPKPKLKPKVVPVKASAVNKVRAPKKIAVVKSLPAIKPKPKVYFSEKEEFFYQHNIGSKAFYEGTSSSWKTKEDDDYALVISTENAEFSMVLNIDDYDGPGTYKLDFYKARISQKGKSAYATSGDKPGKIIITRDTGKLVSGLFEFSAYPNGVLNAGTAYAIKKGKFTVDRTR